MVDLTDDQAVDIAAYELQKCGVGRQAAVEEAQRIIARYGVKAAPEPWKHLVTLDPVDVARSILRHG